MASTSRVLIWTYFYPRPPRGGRRGRPAGRSLFLAISIHALREEGDFTVSNSFSPVSIFLSTPSVRRATGQQDTYRRLCGISIHALREEGDVAEALFSEGLKDFYPRPPRGGRRSSAPNTPATRNFYPRPPRGGRLALLASFLGLITISIHALREEGDVSPSPCASASMSISIHALREEGDVIVCLLEAVVIVFLSTPSVRRAT